MARQLVEGGRLVGLVALLDTGYHSFDRVDGSSKSFRLLNRIAARAMFLLKSIPLRSVRQSAEYFRAKARTVRRRLLTRGWQLLDDWFRAVGRPLPRGLQNVARANYVAWKKYTAQPLDGRLTIFRATDGTFVIPRDPNLGWGDLALGGVEIIDVPGDHVTLVEEPHVNELAVRLQECIDRAVAVGAAGRSPK